MISIGKISIKSESSIVEARNKIYVLAQDLKFDIISTTRLATITSQLVRGMVKKGKEFTLKVWLDQREGGFGLVLEFPLKKIKDAVSIEMLNAVFDSVEISQGEDRFEYIETFKYLPDSDFKPTKEFIAKIKKQIERLPIEELCNKLQEAYTKLKRAEEKQREYSQNLEDMVEERTKRTKELQDAQDELVRKGKLAILGQLAGGVGHELQNPLGVISNAVYYLKTILSDADETTREYLDLIASEVHDSEKIILGLLDLSRTNPAIREEVAISELIELALDKQPPSENVKIDTKIPKDIPLVYIDPQQIGQVMFNLIVNAYQAMPEGGILNIKANSDKEKVYISIADTGCGISDENMKKIFDPLFTTRAWGIGLGLSVSKNLVEVNGGNIEVESQEGKGSTFTVILPIKEI